jgi:multidrug efflux pump
VVPVIYGALARFTRSPEYTARKIEEWEAQEAVANDPIPAAAE